MEEFLYRLSSSAKPLNALLSPLSKETFPYTAGRTPWAWLPLYTMVTFRPDISYSAAKHKAERQSRIMSGAGFAAFIAVLAGTAAFAHNRLGWFRRMP